MKRLPLISVIIPCYNQGQFLGEAIESALKQSCREHEIIVVDDGSTDDSAKVAARYPTVRLIRHENRGLAAARNSGIEASTGAKYLVFLDADDRLLPDALEAGVNALDDHTECAFVYGHYRLIARDGMRMSSSQGRCVRADHYLNMLRSNYIGMHATVMYRRAVFDAVDCFDTSLPVCEDYDLYLRITRNFPIHCHGNLVAEYRQHIANMSSNASLMLKTSLRALASQRKYIRGDKQAQASYKAGVKNWQEYYGKRLIKELRRRAESHDWRQALTTTFTLIRYYPRGFASKTGKKIWKVTAQVPKLISALVSR